ncbi:MAG: hypothetical protein ACFB9M_06140 [Myxococcota bacterium]
MSDDRSYRAVTTYDSEAEVFVARFPELELEGRGASRAEAAQQLEAALEARVEEAAVSGQSLPPAAHDIGEARTIELRLAPILSQDLHHLARAMGLEPRDLALQLVSRGIGQLLGAQPPPAEPDRGREARSEDKGAQRNDRGSRGRGRRREGYRPDMEDQANFLAYVRDMEKGGGRGRR